MAAWRRVTLEQARLILAFSSAILRTPRHPNPLLRQAVTARLCRRLLGAVRKISDLYQSEARRPALLSLISEFCLAL
jgi:hypothetical protein